MKKHSIRQILLYAIIGTALIACAVILIVDKSSGIENSPTIVKSDTVSETPAPIAFVIIDPGHGGKDHGASGTQTGVFEDELNLDVALCLQNELEKYNIKTLLTRTTSDAIAPTKKEDMQRRREIMHESGADMAVSIHMNKFRDSAVHGPMVFYTKGDEPSALLAQAILDSICNETGAPHRLINTGDYYVIRNSRIPAVIVECGFLSNAEDESLLSTHEYRARLAKAIAEGVLQNTGLKFNA